MNAVKFCLSILLLYVPLAQADRFLVFGDSLSAAYRIETEQGWVQLLADELDGHQVLNASVSGETTGGGLSRLPRVLEEVQPDWVLIELGGNDGLRGYPLQSIRSNLSAMVEATISAGARPVLMEVRIPPNYGDRYSNAFQQAYTELANEYEIPLIEFILEDIALDPELMQDDGIHPTAEAQPMITQLVREKLESLLEES
jgi:acyl-CoA thioesterase-1